MIKLNRVVSNQNYPYTIMNTNFWSIIGLSKYLTAINLCFQNYRYLTSVLSIVPLQQFSAIAKITVYLQDQFNMRDDRAG